MLSTTRDDAAPPLLGRTEEQGLLASLLDEVATRGRALVLRGEPGIGKSRLLTETARSARERGMTVLTAAGVTQLAVARGSFAQCRGRLPVARQFVRRVVCSGGRRHFNGLSIDC